MQKLQFHHTVVSKSLNLCFDGSFLPSPQNIIVPSTKWLPLGNLSEIAEFSLHYEKGINSGCVSRDLHMLPCNLCTSSLGLFSKCCRVLIRWIGALGLLCGFKPAHNLLNFSSILWHKTLKEIWKETVVRKIIRKSYWASSQCSHHVCVFEQSLSVAPIHLEWSVK